MYLEYMHVQCVHYMHVQRFYLLQPAGDNLCWPHVSSVENIRLHPPPRAHLRRTKVSRKLLDPEPDPDPHQFADDKPQCVKYEPIFSNFTRIWAFIWKLGSGSGSASDINQNPHPHRDPHEGDESNPDPHQRGADPQHGLKEIQIIRGSLCTCISWWS